MSRSRRRIRRTGKQVLAVVLSMVLSWGVAVVKTPVVWAAEQEITSESDDAVRSDAAAKNSDIVVADGMSESSGITPCDPQPEIEETTACHEIVIDGEMPRQDEAATFGTRMATPRGFFGDYWMCASWWDFVDGAWNYGATKFVLLNDIIMTDRWIIENPGICYTIRGNHHQMINGLGYSGPMILVRNGATLITEDNLTLNGNNHRNNGTCNEGGSSCVDCINASFYATDTVFCNNLNYGYIGSNNHLGGGTGFNIVAENHTGFPAYGRAVNCTIYNCDGAAFFVRDSDGNGAVMECTGCTAYDCSWGYMSQEGNALMYLQDCYADARRSDFTKGFFYGGAGITFGGAYGTAARCTTQGAACGVWGQQNASITDCVIRDSQYGFFGGQGSLMNCTVTGNTASGVCNFLGKIAITDSRISANGTVGVENYGTCCIRGGVLGANADYDIYQGDVLQIGGAILFQGKGIFLTPGKTIDIVEPLQCAEGSILLTIDRQDVPLGRVVAETSYAMDAGTAASMNEKFRLNESYNDTTSAQTNHKARLRAANGRNGTEGRIILSELRYVLYQNDLNGQGLSFSLPASVAGYWKEDIICPAGEAKVSVQGRPLRALVNVGWCTKPWDAEGPNLVNGDGTDQIYPVNRSYRIENVTEDVTLYAVWDTDMQLLFDGNGQTGGDNFTMEHVNRNTILPDNQSSFVKERWREVYDGKEDCVVTQLVSDSFMGWSFREDTCYGEDDCYHAGEQLSGTVSILLEGLRGQRAQIDEQGNVTMICYAVWDCPPIIDTCNLYYGKEEIMKGILTEEKLLGMATVQDYEDAMLGRDISVEVANWDETACSKLGDCGYMTVTYRATDGAGNTTYAYARIYVTQEGIVAGTDAAHPYYVRQIDRTNYQKEQKEDGGLYRNSVWYRDPSYADALQAAFDRLEQGTSVVSYHFTGADILASRQFVEQYGPGNHNGNGILTAWRKEFAHCRQ